MTRLNAWWMLAWRQMGRDLRSGELQVLVLSVCLAVAALTAVGFFSDRLQNGLTRDARQLLGGDVVLASDQPLPAVFENEALARGWRVAHTASFPSMARAADAQGGATKLVAVKAVDAHYPLRGQLVLGRASATTAPPVGQVWVEPGVLAALQLQVGDVLWLGDASLRIADVIVQETDRGGGFVGFSPRVMLNGLDLSATGLIQPASRVTYRLALAGPEALHAPYTAWAQAQIKSQGLRGVQIESLESGRPELRQTLDRAQKFLNLVALLSALLAAVAVGLAARSFAHKQLDACAMLRVLGQSQRYIAWQYSLELGVVGTLASGLGVVLGWGVHHVFVRMLSGLMTTSLASPGWWPAGLGLGVGWSLLIGFGLAPVLQLAKVPPLRVIRRELGSPPWVSVSVVVAGGLGFSALLLAASSDLRLGLLTVGGFLGALGVFAGLTWVLVQWLRRWVPRLGAPTWLVLATRQVVAQPAFAVLQVSALSLGLLALCLLVLLRTDLIDSWRQATPINAPNRFVINIQPDQSVAFRAQLERAGITEFDWYPMFRGRLVSINQRPVNLDEWPQERSRALLDREFNLSYNNSLPGHNTLSAGQWRAGEAGGVSVEQGLADTLQLKLGDTLEFDVASQRLSARITSLRKLDWGSMRVNFFVLFPQPDMNDMPITYIAAFHAPSTQPGFDAALSREFPNLTVVDASATVAQVQQVLGRVISAVEVLFGFTLATGLLVLLACVWSTRERRVHEFGIMRALGARTALLAQVQRAELMGLGALAGFLAACVAMGLGFLLAHYAFSFRWTPSLWTPLWGASAGAFLASLAGWWSLRGVLNRPVLETLRRQT